MLGLGIILCGVEIIARVVELRAEYGRAVDQGMLTASAVATFALAVLAIWLFSRLNDVLRPGAGTASAMRYLGLVTYPLYLMHEGVGGVASSLLQAGGYGQGLALMAGLALSLIASGVVVAVFEPWLTPRLVAAGQAIVARLRLALKFRVSKT
jgi:peptidoglycan/LPS O-acetylase OafA/YrhL